VDVLPAAMALDFLRRHFLRLGDRRQSHDGKYRDPHRSSRSAIVHIETGVKPSMRSFLAATTTVINDAAQDFFRS
jgi:hypothetical protein